MIRRPPRSTLDRSSAASDVYKRQLLDQFVRGGSQAAFAELVGRHLDWVYGVARRAVGGDAHLAEDVTQATFIVLARKAAGIAPGTVLTAWLFRVARYTA